MRERVLALASSFNGRRDVFVMLHQGDGRLPLYRTVEAGIYIRGSFVTTSGARWEVFGDWSVTPRNQAAERVVSAARRKAENV